MPRIADIFIKYTKDKKIRNIFLPAVIGILLVAISFMPSDKQNEKENPEAFSIEEYRKEKEKELKSFITKIDGIEKCSVMISYRDSGTTVFSYNRKTTDEKEEAEIAMLRENGDEHPVTEKISLPEISGITVIADGKKGMEIMLARAVSAAVGTGIHNVEVIINERN